MTDPRVGRPSEARATVWGLFLSAVQTPQSAGRHALRVEYFERVGWTDLRVEIVKP